MPGFQRGKTGGQIEVEKKVQKKKNVMKGFFATAALGLFVVFASSDACQYIIPILIN
tara:strand:+ start:278 stop:448 length:171 start_codon:yes stop_codon:yes gene_type:complete